MCQGCSNNKIYLKLTNTFERVCLRCLEVGPPANAKLDALDVESEEDVDENPAEMGGEVVEEKTAFDEVDLDLS